MVGRSMWSPLDAEAATWAVAKFGCAKFDAHLKVLNHDKFAR